MVTIEKLSNGLTIVLENMNYLRSVSFGVWIKAGSVNETKTNNGISHMLEHMFFKGTAKRTAKQLADDMAKIGGNMNAYTSKECTTFYLTTLDEHLEEGIDLISDMLMNSLFREEDIAKEKGVIQEEIDMYEDSPEDLVHEKLQEHIWKDHPLGFIISGDKEIVQSFTRDQLLDYKKDHYTADNMVLSIAGNFNEARVKEMLETAFSKVSSESHTDILEAPVYHRAFYTKQKDIEQIHMNIAFDSICSDSKEKYALSIVNSILGGSENSRLFQKIREELGLTYSIYTYGNSFLTAGLFHINAALNPAKVPIVYEKTMEVMQEMKIAGITAEELRQTKEQIKTELIIGSESTRTRMNSNGKAVLMRRKIVPLDQTIQKVSEVSMDDINQYMERYFNWGISSLSLVGNLEETDIESVKRMRDE